jgi:hypothetical protein
MWDRVLTVLVELLRKAETSYVAKTICEFVLIVVLVPLFRLDLTMNPSIL